MELTEQPLHGSVLVASSSSRVAAKAATVLLGLWDIPRDRSTAGKAPAPTETEVPKDAWAAPSSNQRSTSSHLKICHSALITEIVHTVK